MAEHRSDPRKNPGIKRTFLQLPATTDGLKSYCITIPDGIENLQVLLDLLTIPTRWFNWQRTSGNEGKITADAWRDALNLPELIEGCAVPQANFRLSPDCGLEYSYDDVLWTPVMGWLTNAADCFTGAPGSDGEDGAPGSDGEPGAPGADGSPGMPGSDGEPGAPGADGDCSDCGDPGQEEQDTEDWLEQACAIAEGMADYIQAGFINACEAVQSGLLAAKTISDIVQEYVDLAPIIGDTIAAIMQFAKNVAEKDIVDIIAVTNGTDFRDLIQCQIYCILAADHSGVVDQALINRAIDQVIFWADDLPPALPYITFYGQAFALFVSAIDRQKMLKIALIYSEERSTVCQTMCIDCLPEPEWCYTFDFTVDDGGWTALYGSWSSDGWEATAAGTGVSVVVNMTIPTTEITYCAMIVECASTSNVVILFDGAAILSEGDVGSGTYENTPTNSGTSLQLNPSSGEGQGGQVTMKSVSFRGTGTNPFGADNCV